VISASRPDTPRPNRARRLENPIQPLGTLSFLAFEAFRSDVTELDAFPEDQWPDNIDG
jgi:cytochrome bd ubiquinol oxidase subunit I